jgi:phospho-N-acetylmuramoyl-pentapeptide-transferase
MLYLFEYLDKTLNISGTEFQYITFRSALAFILSLLLSTIYGKELSVLQNQQGRNGRELGLAGQNEKRYANHGRLNYYIRTLVPVVLFAKLQNIYVVLLIVTTLWMGTIGFIDDYIKIFKKDKQGLKEF